MVINGALQVHESEIRVLLFLVWIWGIIWARFVVNTGLRLQYGGTTKEAMPAPDSWFVQSSTDRYILWWRHYHFMKSPGVFGTAIEKFRVSWWYTGVSELPGRHFYLPIRPRNSPKPIAHSDGWWSTEYRTRNRDEDRKYTSGTNTKIRRTDNNNSNKIEHSIHTWRETIANNNCR